MKPTSWNSIPIAFKTRFVDFPHRGESPLKKHPRVGFFFSNTTQLVDVRHTTAFCPGLFQAQGKKPGMTNRPRPIAFKTRFFDFPHRGETKKQPWDRIPRGRFHTTILSGLFQAGQKAGLTNVVQLRSERVFFDFPHRGETKQHPWDRIPRGRFHTTILSGLFQAGQKAGLTNVVQLRSKRVFSTFPIGAKRKNTLGIEFHEVGFIPSFLVGFSKQGKMPG